MTDVDKWLEVLEGEDLDRIRSQYRQRMADSLRVAKNYTGTEESYRAVMTKAEGLEAWMRDTFHLEGTQAPPPELEIAVEQSFGKSGECPIDRVLSIASERFSHRLATQMELLKIKKIKLHGLLLPSKKRGELALKSEPEGEAKERYRRYQERLSSLVQLLNEKGVFTDDIIIGEGDEPTKMGRQEGYNLIEIPRLNRQVLICDEVGEATFVVRAIFSREVFLRFTKDELLESFPDRVVQVIHTDREAWLKKLRVLLFENNAISGKVDLNLREQVTSAIKARYPTSAAWMKTGAIERRNLEFLGYKLTALSGILGGPASPFTFSDSLQMGLLIYGQEDAALQRAVKLESGDLDEWRLVLMKRFPALPSFMKEGINNFPKIEEYGFDAILRKLKISFVGFAGQKEKLDLAAFIFGELEVIQKAREQCEVERERDEDLAENPGKYRAAFLKLFPHAKDWIDLPSASRRELIVEGMSYFKLLGAFALGNQAVHYEPALRFGLLMYEGEERELIEKALTEEQLFDDPAALRADFLRRYPNASSLIGLSWAERKKLKVGRHPIERVARELGFQFDGRQFDEAAYINFAHFFFPEDAELAEDVAVFQLEKE